MPPKMKQAREGGRRDEGRSTTIACMQIQRHWICLSADSFGPLTELIRNEEQSCGGEFVDKVYYHCTKYNVPLRKVGEMEQPAFATSIQDGEAAN